MEERRYLVSDPEAECVAAVCRKIGIEIVVCGEDQVGGDVVNLGMLREQLGCVLSRSVIVDGDDELAARWRQSDRGKIPG